MNISVIGAGTMGNGIAHVFAQAGFKVNLIDVNVVQMQKALNQLYKAPFRCRLIFQVQVSDL